MPENSVNMGCLRPSACTVLRRMLGAVSLLLVLTTATSCAVMVSHRKAVDSLDGSRSCCESMAQFEYDTLPEDLSFGIDESSDAFDFHSGKSFFKAFRLPEKEIPYRVEIKSFALGLNIDKAHIFFPQAALLNERFALIKQSDPDDFSIQRAGWMETAAETWGVMVKIEGSMVVDRPEARYILIFTTRKLLDSASPYVVLRTIPIIFPPLVTAIPTHKEEIFIPHSPFGRLHVDIVD